MSKRKRDGSDITDKRNGKRSSPALLIAQGDLVKRPHSAPQSQNLPRSAHLNQKDNNESSRAGSHLPSPISSAEQGRPCTDKRKSVVEESSLGGTRPAETITGSQSQNHKDRTTYWVFEESELPPPGYFGDVPEMASSRPTKRRSSSSHGSHRLTLMQQHNIYMNESGSMKKNSQTLCEDLMKGNQSPPGFPMYPRDKRDEVLRSMATESEAMIQQFITPVVIPSVAALRWYGRVRLEHFGDEINALWTNAQTMGPTQPKPDYVAGLRMSAFDSPTWDKLMNYATPATPVLLTSLTCYPVIIGEVKSPLIGLQVAEVQALHAAMIALKSQFSLYRKAYGTNHAVVNELYGQALVFSLCHDNDVVHVSAYYALPKAGSADGTLEFFRKKLQIWSLTLNGGRDKDQPYNFVENLHKTFSPMHLERIRNAARLLPDPAPRTAVSFGTGEMSLESNELEENQQGEESVFLRKMMEELSALRATLEQQREESKAQLEQQREESKAQLQESRAQLQESKAQLQQQKEESKAQLDKLMELLTKRG